MWITVTSPYEYITPENFQKVKDILDWGIAQSRSPSEIAARLHDETDMPLITAQAFVSEELVGAMEYMRDANKTTS